MVKKIALAIASLCAFFALCILLINAWLMLRPPCDRESLYDDAFTGQLYGDLDTALAQDVREVSVFAHPRGLFFPCVYNRDTLTHLYTTRDRAVIERFIRALQYDRSEDALYEGPRYNLWLGMEFTAGDGRKTYFLLWIYREIADISPLPEEKFGYNYQGYPSSALLAVLKEQGILDPLPGYAEFADEHKGSGVATPSD